jgi:hypothetical protein
MSHSRRRRSPGPGALTDNLGSRRRPSHAGVVSFRPNARHVEWETLRRDRLRFASRARTAPVVRFSAAAIKKTERPASCRFRSLRSSSSVQALLWFDAITMSVKECVDQNAVSAVVVPTTLDASRGLAACASLGAAPSPASSRGPVASGRLKVDELERRPDRQKLVAELKGKSHVGPQAGKGAAAPAGTAKAASFTFRLELVATHTGSL